jgi:hypothetical protein
MNVGSPGLTYHPIPRAPPEAQTSQSSGGTLSILTLYAETLAEEQTAREILSARVNILEEENTLLRSTLASLSARFDAHIRRCEEGNDECSPAAKTQSGLRTTKPRPAATPVRTL